MTTKYRCQTLSRLYRSGILIILCFWMFTVTSCNMQGVTSDVKEKETGAHQVNITMEGGSGKAHILSPVTITVKEGESYATLVWSSENYDYIIVDGVKYENENPGGASTFTVPVESFDEPLELIGDTVAMSKPHEIEYKIIWGGTEDGALEDETGESQETGTVFGIRSENREYPKIGGLEPTGRVELLHAEGFDITEYDDFRLLSIYGTGDYLIVPESSDIPDDIPADITVLKQPLDNTYLVSTSVADLIRQIGALDNIKLSGLRTDDWYINDVKDLMRDGKITYAGKYRTPDYELILSQGCDFAIENTMIYHDPQVKEKLEELGIPVLVETSSYEHDPLGRLEWIKVYGALYGREDEADNWYKEQEKIIRTANKGNASGKTVAMFYVSAVGMINVRTPGDYITNMIGLAGGEYIPGSGTVNSSGGMGTLNMQAEDFYAAAKDADILIYNSTIDGEVGSVDDIIAKNKLFEDFKAVREGNAYCLSSDFFQKTTGMTDFITDLSDIINGKEREYTFLTKLK
ncbi:MAG: ABC transporter substrate-binding protein [Lachnospiraceae bacterium]|nr:ABC transporter substrate-binding protein [Lachnospiraceae bacterium]